MALTLYHRNISYRTIISNLSYLFDRFANKVVDPSDRNDPVKKAIRKLAKEHHLPKVIFEKLKDKNDLGSACDANQALFGLRKGRDNQWRIKRYAAWYS